MDHLKTQGISMPKLGLGTFRMQGDTCRAAVESALALGYRHIDTAEMYANEEPIGSAIASSRAASCTSPQKSGMRTSPRTRSAALSTPACKSSGSTMSISISCIGRRGLRTGARCSRP